MTHCNECGWQGEEDDLLTIFAPNFGSDDQVCPECQSHDLDDETEEERNFNRMLHRADDYNDEKKYADYEERQDFLKDK